MNRTKVILAAVVSASVAMSAARSQGPPLSDRGLSVNTLVREDIFAGFMDDDMDRFSRGEKSIRLLLEQRPDDKPVLLAWKAGAALYRAVRAIEVGRADEFREKYREAVDLFAEANDLAPNDLAVAAVIGGTYVIFADRLPQEYRGAAWSRAYDSYQILWKRQSAAVEKLPVHQRGELLAGLAQAAQRTGRNRESEGYLDKILTLLPDTPYESAAKRWKLDPGAATATRIACLTCHAPGRLAARKAAIDKE